MREMKDSGFGYLGIVPVDWKIDRIKNHLSLSSDKNPGDMTVLSLYREHGIVPKDSRNDNHNVTAEDTSNYRYVRNGDFVVNKMKAWQGSLAVSDYEGIVSPAYYVYRFKGDGLYKKYIHYLLRSKCYADEFRRLSAGIRIGQWDLPRIGFESTYIVIPTLKEQKSISKVIDKKLEKVNNLISNVQSQLEKLKAYKQSLITEVVTKGLDSNVEMKDSEVEWIGAMPKHWNMISMKFIGKVRNGLTYAPIDMCDEEEGVLVLRSSNIQEGTLSFNDNVYVNKAISDKLYVAENDILICSRNGSKKLIGKNAIIPKGLCASFGAFMMIFRTSENPKYCKYILDSCIFQYYLGSYLTSTINQLTGQNFNDMKAPFVLDRNEQNKIVEYLDSKCKSIDTLIRIKQSKIEKLELYKRSLIYEYVTGKKEVS